MGETWCRTECQPDEEHPCFQHITISAYADAGEAEAHLGGGALRSFIEERDGLRLGRMVILRYSSPSFTLDGMDTDDLDLVSNVDDEGREIVNAMIRAEAVTGARRSCGLVMGKSIHVVPSARGQGVMRRLLQEVRLLHAGLPYHYAHRAIPQEATMARGDGSQRMERLRSAYMRAGVGLRTPDPESWPEIMTAYWDGACDRSEDTVIDWAKVRARMKDTAMDMAA